MTDDEILQYLETIEPVYTDQIKAIQLDISNKWKKIEVEGRRLNMEMHSPPPVEIVNQETAQKEQDRQAKIRDQLQSIQEQAKALQNRQLILSFKAEEQGYREEWKILKQMPRKQIDDIQKQAELMNIVDNKCMQLQEVIRLIKDIGSSQGFSLSYGGPDILRGNWEDVVDTVSLTKEDGTILYPKGGKLVDDKETTQDSDKHELAVFRAMEKLSFKEVTISIDPENFMLRVSARGKEARTSFAKLGLMRQNEICLNKQGGVFLALNNGSFSPDEPGANRAITRLSELLRNMLKTKDTPFIKNKPQYKLVIPKDNEAKRQATKRTTPYNDNIASTNDPAHDFLKKNDQDYDLNKPIYSPDLDC